ncbi:MAG: 50S ribosomal protein L17 [Candidatus Latescibacteria bacterium]|nr:50S ribosomal protein L17 [Candidatus Latescibacterota bacterium]
MRHGRKVRKLGRTSSHRKALLKNLATSLIEAGSIRTTDAKAKVLRGVVDRLVTFAKRGDLAARRHVLRSVRDPKVVKRLFDEIAPRFVDREGGYTRVLKIGARRGDGAAMSLVTFSGEEAVKAVAPASGAEAKSSEPKAEGTTAKTEA